MKNIKTIIIILAVAGLGYLAYTLANSEGSSRLSSKALSDFAISDTSTIDKLVISDTEGSEGITVLKEGGKWVSETGDCIQQHLVQTMLETIKYIKVKGPVSENAIENINKTIAAHHTKLEIFQHGKLTKTWYVGDPTKDQYGTHMLLKVEGVGKSPEPFIMHLPNMYGNLSTRFVADPLLYKCTEVFQYDPLEIASINVELPDSSDQNFKIVAQDDNTFKLFSNEVELTNFDTAKVRNYILNFRKIHFEHYNYELTEAHIDSMKSENPFYKIEVLNDKNELNRVDIYKRKYQIEKYGLDGELLEFDQDRVWVVLNDGTVVVGQYFVFGHLLQNIQHFTKPS